MNYKVLWKLLGAAIVIGGVYYYFTTKKNEVIYKTTFDSASEDSALQQMKKTLHNEDNNLQGIMSTTAESISVRHQETEKIIRESAENVFGNDGSKDTKNEEAKKMMFEDLDNL